MEHDQWLEKLSRLFDGDLSGPEKTEAEAHLSSCPACAETWRLWSSDRQTLASLKQAALGPGFRAQVLSALEEKDEAPEPRLTWAPWLGLAAAAAFTIALSLPAPESESLAGDPTGLMSVASAHTLPNNPLPDWMTEVDR